MATYRTQYERLVNRGLSQEIGEFNPNIDPREQWGDCGLIEFSAPHIDDYDSGGHTGIFNYTLITSRGYNPDVYVIWDFYVTKQNYNSSTSTVEYSIYAGMYPNAASIGTATVSNVSLRKAYPYGSSYITSGNKATLTYMGQEVLLASGTFNLSHSISPDEWVYNEIHNNNRMPNLYDYTFNHGDNNYYEFGSKLSSNSGTNSLIHGENGSINLFAHSIYNIWPDPYPINDYSVYRNWLHTQEPEIKFMIPRTTILNGSYSTVAKLSYIQLVCKCDDTEGTENEFIFERNIPASNFSVGINTYNINLLENNERDKILELCNTLGKHYLNFSFALYPYFKYSTTGGTVRVRSSYYDQYSIFGNLYGGSYTGRLRISLSDSSPIINYTIVDVDSASKSLTGDETLLIRYVSDAKVVMNSEGQNGAEVVSYKFVNNGFTYSNEPEVVIENVEKKQFDFYATDTRSETSVLNVEAPMIPYVPVSINCKASNITGEGLLTLTLSGNYYPGGFGATGNNITLYYRYKENKQNGEYCSWKKADSSAIYIDTATNTYIADIEVSGLEYMKTYILQGYITDKIQTKVSNEITAFSTPIFDWSHKDFNFNVPVTIQGKQVFGDNTILWSGSSTMNSNETIELSEEISKQRSGIVLVFRGWAGTSSSSGDYYWSTSFVPKAVINFSNNSYIHSCFMTVGDGIKNYGVKTLYIKDKKIGGDNNNLSSATVGGITQSNSRYSLMYVIGV